MATKKVLITAAMVAQLLEMTGCGMLEGKQALEETNGDIELAQEILRKKKVGELMNSLKKKDSTYLGCQDEEIVSDRQEVAINRTSGVRPVGDLKAQLGGNSGMKKIVISSECIGCGLCLMNSYIEETADGKAVPRGTGLLEIKDETEFEKVIRKCPAGAISLCQIEKNSKEDILKHMKSEAETFKLAEITIEDIDFEERHIDIFAPAGVPGQYRYDYSSYNRAKEAARNAIDKAMYSQRKTIIQNVINNYSMDKLSQYLEYREVENNFYYNANKNAQSVLNGWIQEIILLNPNVKIPEHLTKIQAKPNTKKDYSVEFINKYLYDYADLVLKELSSDCYSLSSYVDYCDIDDQEEYAGSGLFGREKYVTRYCFYNTDKAFDEMKRDLIYACKSSFRETVVERGAYSSVKDIVKKYSVELQKELKSKASELAKLI